MLNKPSQQAILKEKKSEMSKKLNKIYHLSFFSSNIVLLQLTQLSQHQLQLTQLLQHQLKLTQLLQHKRQTQPHKFSMRSR